MYLQELVSKLPNSGYDGVSTLNKLKAIDYSNLEGRVKLLFEILKLQKALNIKLRVGKDIPNLKVISDLFAKITTYKNNEVMISFYLSEIIKEISFEIEKENNGKFNFDLVPEILSGKKSYKDFVALTVKVTANNAIWNYTGKSGKKFNGVGLGDVMKLKGFEIRDILEGLKLDDVLKFIDENESKIKKDFKSIRNAYISVLKNQIDPKAESKLLSLIK